MEEADEEDKIVAEDDKDVEKVDLEAQSGTWGGEHGEAFGSISDTSAHYDPPTPDWRYIAPPEYEMFGTFIAPDGTEFREGRYGATDDDGIDMYEYETEVLAKARAEHKAEEEAEAAAKTKEEAEWWAHEEERDALAKKKAEEEAAATKQHDLLDRWTREYDESVIAERERKHHEEVDQWRQQGIEYGFLDDDYHPVVPQRHSTSHGNDSTVATHGVSVQGEHSVDHEEYHFAPMSSDFLAAIRESEAPAVKSGS
jgi:hypothetical protein